MVSRPGASPVTWAVASKPATLPGSDADACELLPFIQVTKMSEGRLLTHDYCMIVFSLTSLTTALKGRGNIVT